MVSHLDEVDDSVIEEGIRRVMEARSQVPSSAASVATVSPVLTSMRGSPDASEALWAHSCPDVIPDVTQRQRGHPILRTPLPLCKNCQVLFAELEVLKQLLECEIERKNEIKQLHSSTKRAYAVKYG